MPPNSRVCDNCRALNSTSEGRCHRCGARLPGPWGGAVRELVEDAFGRDFPVTKAIVGICVAIYILAFLKTGWLEPRGLLGIAHISTTEAARWGAVIAGVSGEKWRYLSAVFVHFSVLHILFNSLATFSFGRYLETVLGSAKFTVMFVVTGGLGFAISDFYYSGMQTTAGASGAIFGMIGCQVGYLIGLRDPMWKQVATQALIYGLVFAVAFPVNNAAHAGGFVLGAPMGYLFNKERSGTSLLPVYRILSVILMLASLGSIYLAHTSPVWEVIQRQEQRYR